MVIEQNQSLDWLYRFHSILANAMSKHISAHSCTQSNKICRCCCEIIGSIVTGATTVAVCVTVPQNTTYRLHTPKWSDKFNSITFVWDPFSLCETTFSTETSHMRKMQQYKILNAVLFCTLHSLRAKNTHKFAGTFTKACKCACVCIVLVTMFWNRDANVR